MITSRLRRDLASAAFVLAGSLFTPGCSVLFNLDTDQCSQTSDCEKLGAGLVCDAGVCVDEQATTGGAGGHSGENSGARPSEGGGDGGEANPNAECETNAECIDEHFGQPFVCRQGRCIGLVTDDCPLVIGAQNLRAEAPIIFGAYALAPDGVSRSVFSRNLDLVVSEFTAKVIGLRGGPNGNRRTLAFVVCNSSHPDVSPGTIDAFEPSLSHLVNTLAVPGVASGLAAKDLQAVFSQRLDRAGTFVISPFEQDSELSALSDGGRLWHLLGATTDLAPTFGPLLDRVDRYLRRDETFLKLPTPGAKLRVALVTANIARETDVRDALLDLPELAGFEVEPFQIDSALSTESPDVSAAANDLLDFAPHIIVALAGSEFIQGVFPVLESGSTWSTRTSGQQRPMYVLGSAMAAETWATYSLKQGDIGGYKTLFDRIVGVAYASADDTELRDKYLARLIGANKDVADPSLLSGSESVYDAAYLMIYAAAAAGEVPSLTGKDLAFGMRRLLDGTRYDVGPASISSVLTALDNGEDVGLRLALGEPNWNAARGTRKGLGSVYCLNNNGSAYEGMFPQGPNDDALRFNPQTGELETKPLPCFPNF
jgi:hypothetical protein